jgi:hypothetical protein
MDRISRDLGNSQDPQLMSVAVDTRNNQVHVEGKSNTPGLEADLESRYGPAVAVTLYPLPGPWANRTEGPGWQLIANGILRPAGDEAYRVHTATTTSEWQELWTLLGNPGEPPSVDMATAIVVAFAHGIGSSCPELRLDDVGFDFTNRLIYSVTSDPLAPRACTADLAGAAYFVVALDRATLPASPFTVRLWKDNPCGPGGCAGHPQEVTLDLGS